NVSYDTEGRLDSSSLLAQLENQLGGRIVVTDWIDETMIYYDYPHLDDQQRRALISSVDIGDYDDAINLDIRRNTLDRAAKSAGVPRFEDDDLSDDEPGFTI